MQHGMLFSVIRGGVFVVWRPIGGMKNKDVAPLGHRQMMRRLTQIIPSFQENSGHAPPALHISLCIKQRKILKQVEVCPISAVLVLPKILRSAGQQLRHLSQKPACAFRQLPGRSAGFSYLFLLLFRGLCAR